MERAGMDINERGQMRYRQQILIALSRYKRGMTAAKLFQALEFACSERTVRNALVDMANNGLLVRKLNYCKRCGSKHKIYKVRG